MISAAALSNPMRVRMGFEISGRLFYLLALALTPLSLATMILQATPIVVVAGAAIVFREKGKWPKMGGHIGRFHRCSDAVAAGR